MQNVGVSNGQRDSALADPAGHDGNDDEEEGVPSAQAENPTHKRSDRPCYDRADGERNEDLEEAPNQDRAVHAEDAANDDRRDVEVEEVAALPEFGDRLAHGLRHE